MTELYWQRYIDQISLQPLRRKDKFWQGIKEGIQRIQKHPKHHLQLYSMCKSSNPYIKQVQSSPNITNETVAELICRDKACELQYCMSLMQVANQNRRKLIDLNGCKEQYESMWNCIKVQRTNLIRRENQLRNSVYGVTDQTKIKIEAEPIIQEKIYM